MNRQFGVENRFAVWKEYRSPVSDRYSQEDWAALEDGKLSKDQLEWADLVLIHAWHTPDLTQWLGAERGKHRYVFWHHVSGQAAPFRLTEATLACGMAHLACNDYTYTQLPAFLDARRRGRGFLLYDTFDLARFERKEWRPSAEGNLRVGYLGHLDVIKRHPRLAEMFLEARLDGAHFELGGIGNDAPLRHSVAAANRSEDFSWLGFLEDVSDFFSRIDVFAYPLRHDSYAGSELVVQEAMWCGVPVVALPAGGLTGLLRHGETAWVASNEDEFVEGLETLARSAELRDRLGRAGAAWVEQSMGSERMAERFMGIAKRWLSEPKRHLWPKGTPPELESPLESFFWYGGVAEGVWRELSNLSEETKEIPDDALEATASDMVPPMVAMYSEHYPECLEFALMRGFSGSWRAAEPALRCLLSQGAIRKRVLSQLARVSDRLDADVSWFYLIGRRLSDATKRVDEPLGGISVDWLCKLIIGQDWVSTTVEAQAGRKLALWGGGLLGQRSFEALGSAGASVDVVLDKNPQAARSRFGPEVEVVSSTEFHGLFGSHFILLTTQYYREVEPLLREAGFLWERDYVHHPEAWQHV
ncbi:glycosyltransferase family 4 protein [Pelagicoccus sp. SDUM812003]|uniref:glycosyltransferase family 4 protein n=1 Tax=Pelagicoccus sp. SDUM812003 TaxID=3041267 RepID=UPI00280C9F98|nr:glycosyltransferase family 4 protein [Pelagicoccus sp. SDUM812003]MDQ8201569.1 glycosyltransferase family 4 protein [Pelagicoccus sp. SDUM812003]